MKLSQLAILVGVAAMALASVFAADTGLICLLLAAYLLTLPSPLRRVTLPWFPLAVALAVVAFSAFGAEAMSSGFVAILGLILAALALPSVPRGHRGFLGLWAVSLALIASVPLTHWPFKLAYLASRPAFEGFSRKLEAGYRMLRPERVGLFLIRGAEMRDGRPCLWTGTDPGGYLGFARNPRGGPNPAAGRYPNTTFNLWSVIPPGWGLGLHRRGLAGAMKRLTIWNPMVARQMDGTIRFLWPTDPATINPAVWDCAHGWTIAAYGNICFSPSHVPTAQMHRLRDDLDRKLEGPIDMGTLVWIWDRLARCSPHGRRYIEHFRPPF